MVRKKAKSKIKWELIKTLTKQGIKNIDIERRFNGAVTADQISRKKTQWAKEEFHKDSKYAKYRTPEYKAWRFAVMKRDGFRCVVCKRGGRAARLQADHLFSQALHPEKKFDIDNGRTLCLYHHKRTPNYGKKALTFKNDIDPKEWEAKERKLWREKQIKAKLKKQLKK